MLRTRNTTRAVAALAIAAIGLSACGDDDETSGGEANAEYAEFCANELLVEAAVNTQDPAAIETAFTNLASSTPDSSKELVDSVIAEAQVFLAAGEDPTDTFNELYAEMIGVVKDNCGFAEWNVTTKDYEFVTDAPSAAGGAVITLTNDGTEFHEVSLFKKNDGVTDSAKDLLALSEDESAEKISQIGGAFAPPGEQAFTTTDLTAGDYFIACFIPQGATQEAFDEMMAGGPEPDGEPHFTLGMIYEFEVK